MGRILQLLSKETRWRFTTSLIFVAVWGVVNRSCGLPRRKDGPLPSVGIDLRLPKR
jgi:hypothetical protein